MPRLQKLGPTPNGATLYAYAPGWARAMAKRLRERGYSVTVDPPRMPGCMIVRLPRPRIVDEGTRVERW